MQRLTWHSSFTDLNFFLHYFQDMSL